MLFKSCERIPPSGLLAEGWIDSPFSTVGVALSDTRTIKNRILQEAKDVKIRALSFERDLELRKICHPLDCSRTQMTRTPPQTEERQ